MNQSNIKTLTKMAISKALKSDAQTVLNNLSSPLRSLGIHSVFYSRFVDKHRINCIGNNTKWMEFLYKNIHQYQNCFEDVFHFKPGFSVNFMDFFPKEGMTFDMYEHDMRNGIYLSQVSKDKKICEIFVFATADSPDTSNQNLIENLNFLHTFTLSFKEKARNVIRDTQLTRKEVDAYQIIKPAVNSESFNPPRIEIKRYYLGPLFEDIYLTKTQFLYIKDFLLGKSIKQIANQYSVSPRTVDKQLENIRTILKCSSKSELIEIIQYSSLFYPIFLQQD